MGFTARLIKVYFNIAYNQVYDLTTARLNHYRLLQEKCIGKLNLRDSDKVLCVGLGTGNELLHIIKANGLVEIVGVDYSSTALKKAYQKVIKAGKDIVLLPMDARGLEFAAETFDKVVCLHVTDFVEENDKVVSEIVRVLKKGGQFVITFPSDKEGISLGFGLFKDQFRHDINNGNHRVRSVLNLLVQVVAGIVYLPLFFRSKRRSYSRGDIEAIMGQLTTGSYQVTQDTLYQDFVVYGEK
jgi:ubiquinone/menaquinone biosynthesis C-methylase UbiE